jgi:hypothetical protein
MQRQNRTGADQRGRGRAWGERVIGVAFLGGEEELDRGGSYI